MRRSTFIAFFIVCAATVLLTDSCGQCTGCDDVYNTEGAALDISDTTLELAGSHSVAEIRVERIVTKEAGTRKCRYRDLVSCMNDGLDSNRLELFCITDLHLSEGIVPARTNLFTQKNLLNPSTASEAWIPSVILKPGPTFSPGKYTFVLRGSTRDGKPIEDVAYVYWQ
jgi:hypothetical protein